MSLLIGFLTFILVVNCVFLALLVLVQLPKKEAGAGLAFGGGASDALFGAGSGTALTQMTKYVASSFLVLSLILAVLNAQRNQSTSRILEAELSRKAAAAPATPIASPTTTTQQAPVTLTPNSGPLTISTAAPTVAPTVTTGAAVNPPPATTQNPAPAAGKAQTP